MSLELEEAEKFRFCELSREDKERVVRVLKEALEKKSEITLAVLYGSFLKDYGFRDIDVAVYVCGSMNFLDYKFTLEQELEKTIGLPVDVRVLNKAPPWFIKKVLEEGRVLIKRTPFIVEKAVSESTRRRKHSEM